MHFRVRLHKYVSSSLPCRQTGDFRQKIVTRVEHIKTSRTNSKTKFFFLDSATWLILDCTAELRSARLSNRVEVQILLISIAKFTRIDRT